MGTFDFLSGLSAPNANAQASAPMQQYQQFANVGQPQGMNYSQVLGGGQASPATQGLDFSKIGQWAVQQSQYPGQQQPHGMDWQKLLSQVGPTQATMGTQSTQSPLQNHARQVALGQVQQGNAGFIGGGQRLGLLGMGR